MSSIYHILDKIPPTNAEELEVEYEQLAQSLVSSGKLRIDTDHHCNFARFTDPALNISLMVSKEELSDPKLIPETKQIFRSLYSKRLTGIALDRRITEIFSELKKQIKKLQPIEPSTMIKLARIFVQSAHPIVIRWLLHDKVEIFLTYSHNIGDMMDMTNWQHFGSNSGMQSTDGKSVAVFVSCGGDPFSKNNDDHPTEGDGWAAIARLRIIAAQELGHFADIKRDEKGRQITRHSANFPGTQATAHVKLARRKDIEGCDRLFTELLANGMYKLLECEEKLRFYDRNKLGGLRVLGLKIQQYIHKQKVLIYAHQNKLLFIKRFAKDKYMALMIQAMIEDMKFNLSPAADVYKRSDKEAEEAIACIEALARVPQQVMKWGHLTTMGTMQNLYKVYYQEVIPSLINNYSLMTGKPYRRNYHTPQKSIDYFFRKLFSNKDIPLIPVREI